MKCVRCDGGFDPILITKLEDKVLYEEWTGSDSLVKNIVNDVNCVM